MCLKRVSETGGCSAIAATINCRSLQASYASGGPVTLDTLGQEGCTPCVILPFQSIPTDCPDSLTAQPSVPQPGGGIERWHDYVHEYKQDIFVGAGACSRVRFPHNEDIADHPGCLAVPPACQDPPRGDVLWSSSHHSQFAVVNSPVVVTVGDLPTQTRRASYFFYRSWTLSTLGLQRQNPLLALGESRVWR